MRAMSSKGMPLSSWPCVRYIQDLRNDKFSHSTSHAFFFLSCVFPWTLLPLLDAHRVEKSRGARTWSRWKSLSGYLTTGYSFPSHPILGWRLVLISMPRFGVTRVGNSHVNTQCCDSGCNLKGEWAGIKLKKITHNKGTSVPVCWEFCILCRHESGRKKDNKIRYCFVKWTTLK